MTEEAQLIVEVEDNDSDGNGNGSLGTHCSCGCDLSTGPTYIPGLNNICSSGVFLLYWSSILFSFMGEVLVSFLGATDDKDCDVADIFDLDTDVLLVMKDVSDEYCCRG